MNAIETRYDGYRFRSRTEARYAVLWRILGWPYAFESQGYALEIGAYLPDFWLPAADAFIEVKPYGAPLIDDLELCRALASETGYDVLLVCGGPGWDTEAIRFSPDYAARLTTLAWFLQERGLSRGQIGMGFDAARSARFEHGEHPGYWAPHLTKPVAQIRRPSPLDRERVRPSAPSLMDG